MSELVWDVPFAVASTLVILGIVVAARYEFDSTFKSRLYELDPEELKDPAYEQALSQVITHARVLQFRRWYMWISGASVGLLAALPLSRILLDEVLKQALPGLLYDVLSQSPSGPARYLIAAVVAGLGFHAVPVISLTFGQAGEGRRIPILEHPNPLLRFLGALFALQQSVLELVLGKLLKYRPPKNPAEDRGSIVYMVQQRMAAEFLKSVSPEVIAREYSKTPEGILMLGTGTGSVIFASIVAHEMVLPIIKHFGGIPAAREALGWCSKRHEFRRVINERVVAQLGDEVIHEGRTVNIGGSGSRRGWKSMLMLVHNPSPALQPAASQNATMLLGSIGGQAFRSRWYRSFRKRRVSCSIVRAVRSDSDLFIAIVVEGTEKKYFSRVAQRLVEASA